MQKVKFKKFHPEAIPPKRMTNGAAGYDIYSLEEVTIEPGQTVFMRTGIGLEMPAGYFLMIVPRSSLCLKKGLDMPHSIGIGDEDFVDEYKVVYRNLGKESVTIEKGERFAQMIFLKYEVVELDEVEQLTQTTRDGGFGSTGS
jgi:dUTP pyrophosphatase